MLRLIVLFTVFYFAQSKTDECFNATECESNPPLKITKNPTTSVLLARAGDNITALNCSVTADSSATIYWTRNNSDGHSIKLNSTVILPPFIVGPRELVWTAFLDDVPPAGKYPYKYQCVATLKCCTVRSSPSTVTVSPPRTISPTLTGPICTSTLQPSPSTTNAVKTRFCSYCPKCTSTLQSSPSPKTDEKGFDPTTSVIDDNRNVVKTKFSSNYPTYTSTLQSSPSPKTDEKGFDPTTNAIDDNRNVVKTTFSSYYPTYTSTLQSSPPPKTDEKGFDPTTNAIDDNRNVVKTRFSSYYPTYTSTLQSSPSPKTDEKGFNPTTNAIDDNRNVVKTETNNALLKTGKSSLIPNNPLLKSGKSSLKSGSSLVPNDALLKTGKSSSNSGTIAGIVIAVIFFIILVVTVLYFLRRRKRKRREQDVQSFHAMHGITNTYALQNYPLPVPVPPATTSDSAEEMQVTYVDLSSDWEISREHLTILDKKLGEGEFGIVKQGLYLHEKYDSETVAIKMLKHESQTTKLEKSDLLAELDILKKVNRDPHPNVLKLIGACITEPILVVTEFCPGGNLRKFLRNSRTDLPEDSSNDITLASTLTQRQLLKFAVDVASGMTYIASLKIIHRDLAARNILIGENEIAKLSDFGLARNISETEQYVRNKQKLLPVKWMALESLEHGSFTTASDVWSYGVLVYEITTLGEEPYRKISPHHILTHVGSGNRMEKPRHCPDKVYTIMRNCWKVDPDERPTFKEIHEALYAMITDD